MLFSRKKVPDMSDRILVVDDDASIRLLVSDVLTDRGHTATAVSSGEEAVRRLEGESCDLFVLDIMMKGMEGLEVWRQVRD